MAASVFIWLIVFNFFIVALSRSNAGDVFPMGEVHRLYGYIAAGGSDCGEET